MGQPPVNAVQALFFFPRGGSAQVTRYLTTALSAHQVDSRIVSGSLGNPGEQTHAETFFRSLRVLPVDYSPAISAYESGNDPLAETVPLHPSYEDRPGVPDRVFTSVAPDLGQYLETRWYQILESLIDRAPDLFHVHHLSPLQPAIRRTWPDIPLIGHIHGTELKMLDGIRARAALLDHLGLGFDDDPDLIDQRVADAAHDLDQPQQWIATHTRWEYWKHAQHWRQRLLDYAAMCDQLIVLTEDARTQAAELLGYDPEKISPVPNGVDTSRFTPERLTPVERLDRWRDWLVEDPQGWDDSGVPGSVSYSQSELDEWFLDASGDRTPVLFFVGRFTNMKRVPLLIRAYARAQHEFHYRAPLVIWGGNPGEWENEHPVTVARQERVPGVFFVGWRGHDELPEGLNAADIMVAPSTNEPFGQVYLEAMACKLPVIATRSGGPPSFINRKELAPDGWLIPPDDEAALADALIEAVNDPEERRQRGANALATVRAEYSWRQVAGTVRAVYDEVLSKS